MADDQQYKVFSPDKIWMSAEARGWAKEHKMSEQEFAKYLIARDRESGDPFAGDVGTSDAFAGDVGEPAGLLTPFENDVVDAALGRERNSTSGDFPFD
jgi:hypothetical protein